MARMDYKRMPHPIAWRILGLAAALLSAMAADAADTSPKQKPKIDRVLAVYVPQKDSDSRLFIAQLNNSFAPGKALEDAALDVSRALYRDANLLLTGSSTPFNVVLSLHPKWDTKD